MKILIIISLILAALIASLVYSQSNITYDAGSGIEIQFGADVCADAVIINGTYSGGGTICQGPLPVLISSFSAAVERNNVTLNWVTEYEINNAGFDIERSVPNERTVWMKLGFVPGSGTTNQQKSYSFRDMKLNTGKLKYRLKQIDYNGNYEYFELENEVIITAPTNFSISQNYPNPSNPRSKIDYELPLKMKITIKLYDIIGREVMTLINKDQEAGYYEVEFDGSNLSSGVYIYRVQASSFTAVKKMVLVK